MLLQKTLERSVALLSKVLKRWCWYNPQQQWLVYGDNCFLCSPCLSIWHSRMSALISRSQLSPDTGEISKFSLVLNSLLSQHLAEEFGIDPIENRNLNELLHLIRVMISQCITWWHFEACSLIIHRRDGARTRACLWSLFSTDRRECCNRNQTQHIHTSDACKTTVNGLKNNHNM